MKRIFFSILLLSQFSWAQSQDVQQVIRNFNTSKVEWQILLSENQTKQGIVWQERKSSLAMEGIRTFAGYIDNQFIGVISIHKNSLSGSVFWQGKNYQITTQKGKIIINEDKTDGSCGTCADGTCHTHEHSQNERTFGTEKPLINTELQTLNTSETPKSIIPSDGILRIYRLAVLVDYPYFKTDFNSDIQQVKDFLARLEIWLNELYMRDLAIKFELVNDNKLIITSEENQVFKNMSGRSILSLSTLEINDLIGDSNYDLGIILTPSTTNENGFAMTESAFTRSKAAARAYPNISTIAHEIGHLFGAWHTYSVGGTDSYQTEPSSGSSVMSYGHDFPRDFFSLASIEVIRKKIAENAAYYPEKQRDFALGVRFPNIPYGIDTKNTAPVIDRSKIKEKYQLPPETSFQFIIPATDADGDKLVYTAHQTDKIARRDGSSKARFYSAKPSTSHIIAFDPKYYYNIRFHSNTLEHFTRFGAADRGTFTFWLGVSDADISPDATQKEHHATRHDVVQTLVEVVNGTPFKITSPVGNNGTRIYNAGQKATLTWQVDKAIFGDNSRVRILMSDDFGTSWKYILTPDTENDGSHEIIIPNIDLSERIIHDRFQGKTADSGKGLFRIEVIDHIATAITDGGAMPLNGGFEIRKSQIQFTQKPEPIVKVNRNSLPFAVFPVKAITSCSQNPEVKITYEDKNENNRIMRTWTATDDCGNTAYLVQHIEIEEDTTEPLKWIESSFPENKTVSCSGEVPPTKNPETIGGKGTTNISVSEVIENKTCDNRYTLKRTYTATNGDEQITHIQNIEVNDITAPLWNTANLPSDKTVNHDDPIPTQTVLTASDNCGTAVVTKSERKENGKVIYTWVAKDACGNETQHTQTITINPKPVEPLKWVASSFPENQSVSCLGEITPAQNPQTTGGKGITNISVSEIIENKTCDNRYSLKRIYTATNENEQITHTQTIEVNDDIAPSFVGDLPQNIMIEEGQNIPTQAVLTATDNCDVANVETSEREILENGKLKQKIYTWIAKDACGNQTQHEQIIEIKEKKTEVPNNIVKPKLYPNPTNDSFQLSIENVKGVKVYNTAGRLIKTFEPQQKYDISNLTTEVYIIAVETENGTEFIKLVKQ